MDTKKLWNAALILAVITVFYNLLEGLVSIYFGVADETLSLFGFGLDSFIEVISGIGVWHMITRIDSIGALGIAYYAFKEGKESMDKAEGKKCDRGKDD